MIIDYKERSTGVDISFVNENKNIEMLRAELPYGYYKYVECEEVDPAKVEGLKSFSGRCVRREADTRFRYHNINEYFNEDLKNNYPHIYEKISALNIPIPYSIDIETEITEEFGYSSAQKAENRILSISITDINLKSILFILRNNDYNLGNIDQSDQLIIQQHLKDALGEEKDYDFHIRIFDKEVEMLETFLSCVREYFHCNIGWNFLLYDVQYISNRCKRLGINIGKASPTGHTTQKKMQNKYESTYINLPQHRLFLDYMEMFRGSQIYGNLESYSLNYVCEIILKKKKISYQGNLRKLYQDDYLRFIAYAFVDTLLVMMLHKKVNFLDIDFFEAYMNRIPYSLVGQNNISDALIYNHLRKNGQFLCESNFNHSEKQSYQGGYVKNPTKKIAPSVMGLDFSALYPNSMITNGLSPERFVDKIKMEDPTGNNKGKVHPDDLEKWEKYKQMGYTVTPMGSIYDNRDDGLYIKIEKDLIKRRGKFKSLATDIYLNLMEKIQKVIDEKEQQNKNLN